MGYSYTASTRETIDLGGYDPLLGRICVRIRGSPTPQLLIGREAYLLAVRDARLEEQDLSDPPTAPEDTSEAVQLALAAIQEDPCFLRRERSLVSIVALVKASKQTCTFQSMSFMKIGVDSPVEKSGAAPYRADLS